MSLLRLYLYHIFSINVLTRRIIPTPFLLGECSRPTNQQVILRVYLSSVVVQLVILTPRLSISLNDARSFLLSICS
jgi:hypothetical protein